MKKTVCLDLDGVLAQYDGWRGEGHLGDPIPGALEAVRRLQKTYDVVVHTTRSGDLVSSWLERHGFTGVRVSSVKPPAVAYVDDRAVRFTGTWDESVFEGIDQPAYWEK